MEKNEKSAGQVSEKKKISFFKRFFWVSLVFVIAVAITVFWHLHNRPVLGVIHILPGENQTAAEIAPVFERFEGDYISFGHDAKYIEKRHDSNAEAHSGAVESALLSEKSVNAKKIIMTINNLVGKTMQDNADYNLRKKYPKRYEEKRISFSGLEWTTFSSVEKGLTERIFFMARNSYLVEMTFTSSLQDDEKWDAEIEYVLKSIQWKK